MGNQNDLTVGLDGRKHDASERASLSGAVPSTVSGYMVRRLMARHRVTIRQVATRWGLTLARVREVRKNGGPNDWPLMIATMAREAEAAPAPSFVDVSAVTEYGMTQRLSRAVRVF